MQDYQLSTCIQQYLDHLEGVRRLSANTINAYSRDLRELSLFCDSHEINFIAEIDASLLRLFSAKLRSKGLSGKSLQRKLSSIRGMFAFYCEHIASSDKFRRNPVLEITAPRANRKLPNTVDVDQICNLLEGRRQQLLSTTKDSHAISARSEKTLQLQARNYAILELLYGTGMRLSELAQLNVDSIDLNSAVVSVLGKGNKQRILPLGKKTRESLQLWLEQRANLLEASGLESPNSEASQGLTNEPLFLSNTGKRLNRRTIQRIVSDAGHELPDQQNLHPHKIRHSYASHLLESSQDLRAVQELLGHSNISTTQIYTHLDFQQLSKAYDQYHPKAKKKTKSE